MNRPPGRAIPIQLQSPGASLARGELLCRLAAPLGGASPLQGARFSIRGFDDAFGEAEVRVAVVAGEDLRYAYVNESYRNIRPDVEMVGRTYGEVFPEAAAAGAQANLQRALRTNQSWAVDDYPTPLPNRDVPAWWQGECVPIALFGGEPDAVLILIWEVTRRYLKDVGPAIPSREQTRMDIARAKLTAQMSALGLTRAKGWSIGESVRETAQGTTWTLRPMHLREESPALEVVVVFERES